MGRIVNRDDNGIIVAKFLETMGEAEARVFVTELREALVAGNGKSKVLTDITAMKGNPSREAKEIVAEGIRDNRPMIEKSAVCGLSTTKRLAAWFIFLLSGRKDIKLFKTREDAVRYLLGG